MCRTHWVPFPPPGREGMAAARPRVRNVPEARLVWRCSAWLLRSRVRLPSRKMAWAASQPPDFVRSGSGCSTLTQDGSIRCGRVFPHSAGQSTAESVERQCQVGQRPWPRTAWGSLVSASLELPVVMAWGGGGGNLDYTLYCVRAHACACRVCCKWPTLWISRPIG